MGQQVARVSKGDGRESASHSPRQRKATSETAKREIRTKLRSCLRLRRNETQLAMGDPGCQQSLHLRRCCAQSQPHPLEDVQNRKAKSTPRPKRPRRTLSVSPAICPHDPDLYVSPCYMFSASQSNIATSNNRPSKLAINRRVVGPRPISWRNSNIFPTASTRRLTLTERRKGVPS